MVRTRVGLLFLLMPVVGWAAWRLQLRGSATAALVISALASWGATRGLPAFADEPLAQQMLILQAFNVTVALTSLFLSALVTERLRAERRLEQAAIELEVPRRGADLGAGGGDGRIGGRDRRTPRHGARPTGSRAAALRGPADGQDRELGVPGARGRSHVVGRAVPHPRLRAERLPGHPGASARTRPPGRHGTDQGHAGRLDARAQPRPGTRRVPDRPPRRVRAGAGRDLTDRDGRPRGAGSDVRHHPGRHRHPAGRAGALDRRDAAAEPPPARPPGDPRRGPGRPLPAGDRGRPRRRRLVRRDPAPRREARPDHRRRGGPRAPGRPDDEPAANGRPGLWPGGGFAGPGAGPPARVLRAAARRRHGHAPVPRAGPGDRPGHVRQRRAPTATPRAVRRAGGVPPRRARSAAGDRPGPRSRGGRGPGRTRLDAAALHRRTGRAAGRAAGRQPRPGSARRRASAARTSTRSATAWSQRRSIPAGPTTTSHSLPCDCCA